MLYSYLVERLVRRSFANVQNHDYDEVLKAIVPDVAHHFAGDHALGGTRHDTEALRRWFERLGRIMPKLQFEIKHIWVKGMPWNTTVDSKARYEMSSMSCEKTQGFELKLESSIWPSDFSTSVLFL